jgi:isocitrate lyase
MDAARFNASLAEKAARRKQREAARRARAGQARRVARAEAVAERQRRWESQNAALAEMASKRRRRMAVYREKGLTLAAIGRIFGGLSRQRVKAILDRGKPQP